MPRSLQLGTSDPRYAVEEAPMDVGPDLREVEQEGYGELRFQCSRYRDVQVSGCSVVNTDILFDVD